jgi:hypothetical protein
MAIHMPMDVGGRSFNVTLSRDEAGNYVAEARPAPLERAEPRKIRVVNPDKERAMHSLLELLGTAARTQA